VPGQALPKHLDAIGLAGQMRRVNDHVGSGQ
jgi:hypothetical protein